MDLKTLKRSKFIPRTATSLSQTGNTSAPPKGVLIGLVLATRTSYKMTLRWNARSASVCFAGLSNGEVISYDPKTGQELFATEAVSHSIKRLRSGRNSSVLAVLSKSSKIFSSFQLFRLLVKNWWSLSIMRIFLNDGLGGEAKRTNQNLGSLTRSFASRFIRNFNMQMLSGSEALRLCLAFDAKRCFALFSPFSFFASLWLKNFGPGRNMTTCDPRITSQYIS